MTRGRIVAALAGSALALAVTSTAQATVIETTIDGSDAIWLAGRTDLTIPPAGVVWVNGLARHPITPEMIQETRPPGFAISAGGVLRVLDPATGGISFFNGFGGTTYGPEGNGAPNSSNIGSFGGISGYIGTQGALVGVFLDNTIPSGSPPVTLDFSLSGYGTEFTTLSPGLGQIFYIGNGETSAHVMQEFIAPAGTTRFFLGITDAFSFNGPPGAFDDNDGSYRIRVGINEDPNHPITSVPEPSTWPLLAMGLMGLGLSGLMQRRRQRN